MTLYLIEIPFGIWKGRRVMVSAENAEDALLRGAGWLEASAGHGLTNELMVAIPMVTLGEVADGTPPGCAGLMDSQWTDGLFAEGRRVYLEPLLPCPFCGGEGILNRGTFTQQDAAGAGAETTWFVHCRCCATEGPWKKTAGGAVTLWNDRQPSRATQDEEHRLREALNLAAIRLGILVDRMRGCHAETGNHELITEAEEFHREAQAALEQPT